MASNFNWKQNALYIPLNYNSSFVTDCTGLSTLFISNFNFIEFATAPRYTVAIRDCQGMQTPILFHFCICYRDLTENIVPVYFDTNNTSLGPAIFGLYRVEDPFNIYFYGV